VFDYTASCDSDGRITNKALREATRKRHKHDVGKSVRELQCVDGVSYIY
jgi:hypothetical protein